MRNDGDSVKPRDPGWVRRDDERSDDEERDDEGEPRDVMTMPER